MILADVFISSCQLKHSFRVKLGSEEGRTEKSCAHNPIIPGFLALQLHQMLGSFYNRINL